MRHADPDQKIPLHMVLSLSLTLNIYHLEPP